LTYAARRQCFKRPPSRSWQTMPVLYKSVVRRNWKTLLAYIPITNIYDHNRDGKVAANDQIAAGNNPTSDLNTPKHINISAAGPFAPDP
jgi:hypothetical protein